MIQRGRTALNRRTGLFTGTAAMAAFGLAAAVPDSSSAQSPCITCYPNCDQSTTAPMLNVADFNCFLAKFAAEDPYANCDGSTTPPIFNVADFNCFLQRFAAECPTMTITPTTGGLGTPVTLTITNNPGGLFTFDSTTTAHWTGTYTPIGGSATSEFGVTFSAGQIHEISSSQARIILGDGTISAAPSIEQLTDGGLIEGTLIVSFANGASHYQCVSIGAEGNAGQWRHIQYLSSPGTPGAAQIGPATDHPLLLVVSDLSSTGDLDEESLIAARGFHLAAVVNVTDSPEASSTAPASILVSLVGYSAAGTEVSRLSALPLQRSQTTLVAGKISYVSDLQRPIIVTDDELIQSYSTMRPLRCPPGGSIAIVPETHP